MEIFLNEVNGGDLKAFSVQIFQNAGLGREVKTELVRVKRLKFSVIALVELAVFSVAEERPARCGHLGADLVRAARQQLALNERQPVF